MNEIFKAIFDVNKIPTKIFFVIFLVGTFVFYAPSNLVPIKFNNNSDLKIYAYIIYLISSGIFIINCITGFSNYIKRYLIKKEVKKELREVLYNLDTYEKAVLREFYLYNKNTLDLPYEDNIVKGLVSKRVLCFASQFGGSILLSGYNSTFKINDYFKKIIDTQKDLELFNNPNQQQQQYILNNRPHWTQGDISYIKD